MANDIILLDGVKYARYEPKSEAEFRKLVVYNIAEVFGNDAIYIDIERNLENELGKARRPDGFVLDLSDNSFYVVEFELAGHSTYGHIDPQINGFLQAVDNWNTRQKIAGILKKYMEEDVIRLKAIKDHIGETTELFQFFLERVLTPMHDSGQPNTFVIIDSCCEELEVAMRHRTPRPSIIEVAIYAREGAETVKALRFEPQYSIKLRGPEHVVKEQRSSEKPKSGKLNKESFLALADENGKTIFEQIFNFANEKGLIIKWGKTGFSLNAVDGKKHVPLCFGYNPNSVFKESIYTGFDFFSDNLKNADEMVEYFTNRLLELGNFQFVRKEPSKVCKVINLKCRVDIKFNEKQVKGFLEIIEDVAKKIEWK